MPKIITTEISQPINAEREKSQKPKNIFKNKSRPEYTFLSPCGWERD